MTLCWKPESVGKLESLSWKPEGAGDQCPKAVMKTGSPPGSPESPDVGSMFHSHISLSGEKPQGEHLLTSRSPACLGKAVLYVAEV